MIRILSELGLLKVLKDIKNFCIEKEIPAPDFVKSSFDNNLTEIENQAKEKPVLLFSKVNDSNNFHLVPFSVPKPSKEKFIFFESYNQKYIRLFAEKANLEFKFFNFDNNFHSLVLLYKNNPVSHTLELENKEIEQNNVNIPTDKIMPVILENIDSSDEIIFIDENFKESPVLKIKKSKKKSENE